MQAPQLHNEVLAQCVSESVKQVKCFLPFHRCVGTGGRCVWHLCFQLLPAVQPGRQTVVHLQRARHWCTAQGQGQTSSQVPAALKASCLLMLFQILRLKCNFPPCRFFLVTMMTEGWLRADWTGWCPLSLFACCHMIFRMASTFDLRLWAVVMVGRLLECHFVCQFVHKSTFKSFSSPAFKVIAGRLPPPLPRQSPQRVAAEWRSFSVKMAAVYQLVHWESSVMESMTAAMDQMRCTVVSFPTDNTPHLIVLAFLLNFAH